jgi:hypothetical protein
MMKELTVGPQVITKNLYGLHANKGEWVMLSPILMDDINKLEDIVNDVYDMIHVSLWTLMFKPEDFSAFRIE